MHIEPMKLLKIRLICFGVRSSDTCKMPIPNHLKHRYPIMSSMPSCTQSSSFEPQRGSQLSYCDSQIWLMTSSHWPPMIEPLSSIKFNEFRFDGSRFESRTEQIKQSLFIDQTDRMDRQIGKKSFPRIEQIELD